MIFTSAFCFVLVLSYTSASTDSKNEVDQLVDRISSEAATAMAKIATVFNQDPNANELELRNKLLETLRDRLQKMGSGIKKLGVLAHKSVQEIAKILSGRINENDKLKKALVVKGKQSPRFIGALVIGVTQIVTDVVNMALRRY